MKRAIVLAALLLALPAHAATRLYVLAIGNNALPVPAAEAGLAPLRYADDDAAAVAELGLELGAEVAVLSLLDAASQRRFPAIGARSRPPTLVELSRIVAYYEDRFAADQRAGDDPVLWLFYSGHGTRRAASGPALALLDGPLTTQRLYDEVLAALPARYIHLVIDACHAEAVVRPRDLDAATEPVPAPVAREVLARASLARFPHVGALLASTDAAASHEWDAFERGVFTHELLSGVRGAADVNGDGRVEYSELGAFLSAANRDITDPRAHPAVLVHAPPVNGHAPLVDLGAAVRGALLIGSGKGAGALLVEDERGLRIADLRPEQGFRYRLLVPSGGKLFIRGARDEAVVAPAPGARIALDELPQRPRRERARGAIESALQAGLFATPFGPTYYRGFVDAQAALLPVTFPTVTGLDEAVEPRRDPVLWAAGGVAVGFAAVAATFTFLAFDARGDLRDAVYERPASEARTRLVRNRALAVGAGLAAVAAGGVALWRYGRDEAHIALVPSLVPGGAGLAFRLANR